MLPPPTDLFALLGVDLVVCAVIVRLLGAARSHKLWAKIVVGGCFALLWIPAGKAQLPLLAYLRGVSSDFSVSTLVIAVFSVGVTLFGAPRFRDADKQTFNAVIACAAVFLYPLALGLGNWDAYRLGWNAAPLWVVLLAISLLSWFKGQRLLPLAVACALLGWSAGLLESTNLWDYLLDPWLSAAALMGSLRHILGWARKHVAADTHRRHAKAAPVKPV